MIASFPFKSSESGNHCSTVSPCTLEYHAEQTLANFAAIARDEVDMDKLTAALLGVVEETMQPEKASLWLKTAKK